MGFWLSVGVLLRNKLMPSKKQSTICRTLKWFSEFKTTYRVSPLMHFEKEKEFFEEGLHLIQFLDDNTQRQHNKCWKCTSLQNTHLLKLCILSSVQRYAYSLVRFRHLVRVRKRSCGIALKYLVLLPKKLAGTKWFAPIVETVSNQHILRSYHVCS